MTVAQGWALVPGSEPPRFVAVDARLDVVRFAPQKPFPLRWDAVPHCFEPESAAVVVAPRHWFRVLSIGWAGALFCTDDDLDLLVHLVRVVERAILLLVWLFGEHQIAAWESAGRQ